MYFNGRRLGVRAKIDDVTEEQKAYNEGYTAGIEQGKQAEYDRFWDALQYDGERTNYERCFTGTGWSAETLKPKYDLVCNESTANMFQYCSARCSLPNLLEKQGIQLDTSATTEFTNMFQYSSFTEIAVDVSSCGSSKSTLFIFAGCKNLEKLSLKMSADTYINSNWFTDDDKLTEITIDGEIGRNGFNVSYCPNLTHDSLMSIINALMDYSEDTSGTTWKVTLGTTNLAKLTDAEKAIATEKGWTLV